MMKRWIVAASLLVISAPALAQEIVASPQECPPDTRALANYEWQDSRFVRDGWACQVESGN
jgi:hypothetical protein